MPRPSEKLWLLLVALAALAAGCKPKIGDECKISTDCSAAGDRLCDITAPGGYCTVYNCEPTTCPPGESVCVEFGEQRSPVQACQDKQSPSPYGRAFCMAVCDKDSDCRSGYVCQDFSRQPNDWSAQLIDTDRGNKACVVPFSAAPVEDDGGAPGFGDVCRSVLPPAAGGSSSMSGGASGVAASGAGAAGAGDGGVSGQGSAGAP